MGKLFGTDGIRGKAEKYPMTTEMAMRVGRAVADRVDGAALCGGLQDRLRGARCRPPPTQAQSADLPLPAPALLGGGAQATPAAGRGGASTAGAQAARTPPTTELTRRQSHGDDANVAAAASRRDWLFASVR